MKSCWEYKKLEEVCDTSAGGTPLKSHKEYYENGKIPWLRSGEVNKKEITESELCITEKGLKNSSAKLFPPNTVLVAMYGATAGQVGILKFESATNQAVCGILPNKNMVPEFLYYFMTYNKETLVSQAVGNAQPNISQNKIKGTYIPILPVPEQKRIVSILDESFAAIAKAKENAEKNLQNARELFDSFLNSIDADKVPLGELVNITTGKLDANAAIEGGVYPFFTCSREIYAINHYAFDCEAILLAGNNAVGDFNVKHYNGKFNAYQRTYVITVNKEKKVLYRYLYFQMLRSLKEFKMNSVGAGTKFLKLGIIKNLKVALPSIPEQQNIVLTLDTLLEQTQKIDGIYQQKLADFEELKKSILQKAFNGEL